MFSKVFKGKGQKKERQRTQELIDAISQKQTAKALGMIEDPKMVADINEYLNPKDTEGYAARTCLFEACGMNNLQVVEELLNLPQINVNRGDTNDYTPLHEASYNGNLKYINIFLSAGAKITKDNKGWTPLHFASCEGQALALTCLLQHDSGTVNETNQEFRTPLHLASLHNQYDCVRVLVSRFSADITATDFMGDTALDIAERKGHQEIVTFLKKGEQGKSTNNGADPENIQHAMKSLILTKGQNQDKTEEKCQVLSHLRNQKMYVGDEIFLTVELSVPRKASWLKDGKPCGRAVVVSTPEVVHKLIVKEATLQDSGTYTVLVDDPGFEDIALSCNVDIADLTSEAAGLFKAKLDKKTTYEDHHNISPLFELVCMVEFPTSTGMEFGTGFYFGPVADKLGTRKGCILTSFHLVGDGLMRTHPDKCKATFNYYQHFTQTLNQKQKTYNLGEIIAGNESLDYVLITIHERDIVDRFTSMGMGGAKQLEIQEKVVDLKLVCPSLRLIGHPGGAEMQIDIAEVQNKEDITAESHVWDVLSKVNRGLKIGSHVKYLNDSIYAYYHCSSFHGSSGAPCFHLQHGKVKLVCVHKGGIYYNNSDPKPGDESDLECGVFMECIMEDIKTQLNNPNSPWRL